LRNAALTSFFTYHSKQQEAEAFFREIEAMARKAVRHPEKNAEKTQYRAVIVEASNPSYW
jgi:hypothetical protein